MKTTETQKKTVWQTDDRRTGGTDIMSKNEEIRGAMTIQLGNEHPDYPEFAEGIRRAPDRGFG